MLILKALSSYFKLVSKTLGLIFFCKKFKKVIQPLKNHLQTHVNDDDISRCFPVVGSMTHRFCLKVDDTIIIVPAAENLGCSLWLICEECIFSFLFKIISYFMWSVSTPFIYIKVAFE